MTNKVDSISSQCEELYEFYNINKDDLTEKDSQKDMKFYWLKKLEQLKTKVSGLSPALTRAVKNNYKIMNQSKRDTMDNKYSQEGNRQRINQLQNETDSLGRSKDLAS